MTERNNAFLRKAEELEPMLHTREIAVSGGERVLKKGDSLCLDFGEHLVGTVTLRLSSRGSHPDAPLWLRLKFAERMSELKENVEDYCVFRDATPFAMYSSRCWISPRSTI